MDCVVQGRSYVGQSPALTHASWASLINQRPSGQRGLALLIKLAWASLVHLVPGRCLPLTAQHSTHVRPPSLKEKCVKLWYCGVLCLEIIARGFSVSPIFDEFVRVKQGNNNTSYFTSLSWYLVFTCLNEEIKAKNGKAISKRENNPLHII